MYRTNANQQNNQPWLIPDVVAVPGAIHGMPKHLENFLPKFDLNKKAFFEDHVKKFILLVRLMNVEYEDVVYRSFPYIFENKASTWYFYLAQASITIWNSFETTFIENFGEENTPSTLVLYLSMIKMDSKEKFKDFNQIFLTLMNKIAQAPNPIEDVSIEFYTLTLLFPWKCL